MVLRLARIDARAVAVPQLALAEHGLDLARPREGRIEAQDELIGAALQQRPHLDAARHEHVVAVEQQDAVEPDAAAGVHAFEHQVLVGRQVVDVEPQAPGPRAVRHPGDLRLVHRMERIRDATGGKQGAVRAAGHLCRQPVAIRARRDRSHVRAGGDLGHHPRVLAQPAGERWKR